MSSGRAMMEGLEERRMLSTAWSIGWNFSDGDLEQGWFIRFGDWDRVRGKAPRVRINEPDAGQTYRAGGKIRFAGNASDDRDLEVLPGRFVWRAEMFVEGRSVGRVIDPIRGFRAGEFTLPEHLPNSPDQFIRLTLTVKDSDGNKARKSVDLRPRVSRVRVETNLPGEDWVVRVNGKTRRGVVRTDVLEHSEIGLEAPRRQRIGSVLYVFDRWSDGGERAHRMAVPAGMSVVRAIYRRA